MSESGFVRINVPRNIKAGDTIRVRTLAVHPMEGIERAKSGEIVSRKYNFIYKFSATYNGKVIVTIIPTQSISSNPYLSFPFKVREAGELKVVFEDTQGLRHEATKKIEFS